MKLVEMVNYREELRKAILRDSSDYYNFLRSQIIAYRGYGFFRDTQNDIFKEIGQCQSQN